MLKAKPNLYLAIVLCLILLITLFTLPIFNDESIYIRWAIAAKQTGNFLYSLTHGDKPPLLTWILIPTTYFPVSPFLSARILMFGFTLLTAFILGSVLTSTAGLIFLVLPYTVIFGRQVLAEPVIFLFVASVIALKRQTHKPQTWLYLSALLCLSLYLKSSLSLFLCLLIAPEIKQMKRDHLLSAAIPAIIILFPFVLPSYRQLFFTAQLHFVQVMPSLSTILARLQTLAFQFLYFLPALPLLFPLHMHKKHFSTLTAISVYLCFYIFTAPDANARYLAPIVPALVSILNTSHPKTWFLSIFVLISFFPRMFLVYVHQSWDYAQYYTHWSSGVGLPQLKADLDKLVTSPTIILVRPDSGHPEDFVVASYARTNNPQLAYATPEVLDFVIKNAPKNYQLLYVSRDLQLPPEKYKLELMSTYPKLTPDHFVNLYRLLRD